MNTGIDKMFEGSGALGYLVKGLVKVNHESCHCYYMPFFSSQISNAFFPHPMYIVYATLII